MSDKKPDTLVRHASWYGWLPDLPDQRDHLYAKVHVVPRTLPAKVDLRAKCPPVENQGQLGRCTANLLAGALEFLERKQKQPVRNPSPLFVCSNERVIEHSVKQDAVAMLRDGIKTAAKQAMCMEKLKPYVIISALPPRKEIRAYLADSYPFVFSFTVYEISSRMRWLIPAPCRCLRCASACSAATPGARWAKTTRRSASSCAIPGTRTGASQRRAGFMDASTSPPP